MDNGTLTNRELEVLGLIAQGKSTKDISFDLGISFKTVACHRERIMMKLGASNAADMVARAARSGLVDVRPESPANPDPLWAQRIEELCHRSRTQRQALRAA